MKKTAKLLGIVFVLVLAFAFIPGRNTYLSASAASGDASGDASDTWTINVEDKATVHVLNTALPIGVVVKKNGTQVTGEPITWTSDNESVVTVNSQGQITAKAFGTANVTGELTNHPGVKDTCKVTVVKPEKAESIKITPKNGKNYMWVGDKDAALTDLFDITVTPEGAEIDPEWSVSNKKVADIKTGNTLSPVSRGPVTVTLTDKTSKKSASCDFYIDQFYCAKTEPASAKWRQKSKVTLDFDITCKHDDTMVYSAFKRAYVDGKQITLGTDYETAPGSVVIKLKPDFLNTLSKGKHYLEAVFEVDGDEYATAKIQFQVVGPTDSIGADTGDTTLIGVGAVLFLLSLTYVALFTYDKKTRRFKRRSYAFAGGNGGSDRQRGNMRRSSTRSRGSVRRSANSGRGRNNYRGRRY